MKLGTFGLLPCVRKCSLKQKTLSQICQSRYHFSSAIILLLLVSVNLSPIYWKYGSLGFVFGHSVWIQRSKLHADIDLMSFVCVDWKTFYPQKPKWYLVILLFMLYHHVLLSRRSALSQLPAFVINHTYCWQIYLNLNSVSGEKSKYGNTLKYFSSALSSDNTNIFQNN